MSSQSYKVSSLPISSTPLPSRLVADPASVRTGESAFVPSSIRRARLVDPNVHFSYVRPLVLGFPYDIRFPTEPDSEEVQTGLDKAAFIEDWIAKREPNVPVGDLLVPEEDDSGTRLLLSISPSALPFLDVGNAPSLLYDASAKPDEAANELLQVLGGVAIRKDFEPYALRYSGHQFGSWAGQLGDGRATTVLSTSTSGPDSLEIQLKGSGRTPYSRTADGLAVTRSSIREYLCSEYMHALGIPTTRALSLISAPDVQVYRERKERASVVARVAPSFVRIGNFQAFNPLKSDQGMMWFGGGQQTVDLESLRLLGEYTAECLLHIREGNGVWAEKLVWEVAERNAKMVAAWQAFGFMHGVLNTDKWVQTFLSIHSILIDVQHIYSGTDD